MEIIKVILTSVLSAVALFLIAKIMGRKQINHLDFFDYITAITIGSIGAELATELEKPMQPLIAILVYGLISILLSFITQKFPNARKYINGSPIILMNNGKLYRENFKKSKIELSEFLVLCRELGYFNLNDIKTAIFEYNGKLTVLPYSDKRPTNASDLNIKVKEESITTEVILDGKVLSKNLKAKGLNDEWLKKELKTQGVKREKDVFCAFVDDNNALTVFTLN